MAGNLPGSEGADRRKISPCSKGRHLLEKVGLEFTFTIAPDY
jgi:hypothetical protein